MASKVKKMSIVKQDEEIYVVWLAHNITRRKLKAGIYVKHPKHRCLIQTYRREFKRPGNKYRYETEGYAENVICRIVRK